MTIKNIFCIGRNYSEHAKELNNPIPATPVVFLKPNSSVVYSGGDLILPSFSQRVDHEVEVVLKVGKTGKNISEEKALDYISHLGVGIDFTARDLQAVAKDKGLPWSIAKGFDTFTGLGNFKEFNQEQDNVFNLNIELKVNGEIRQKGNSKDMLFSIPKIISYLSQIFTLSEGDLIFTGTPEGVGILHEGDQIEATLENYSSLNLGVRRAE